MSHFLKKENLSPYIFLRVLDAFCPNGIIYHIWCVFTVVFTVVFTACSLRVHCADTALGRLGGAKGAKKHVVSFGVATAAGLLTCARWSALSLSYVGAHECIHSRVNAGTCTRAHMSTRAHAPIHACA